MLPKWIISAGSALRNDRGAWIRGFSANLGKGAELSEVGSEERGKGQILEAEGSLPWFYNGVGVWLSVFGSGGRRCFSC